MQAVPTSYDLEFEPDLKKFTFSGKAVIKMDCRSTISMIKLDAAELDILDAKATMNRETRAVTVEIREDREMLLVRLGKRHKGPLEIRLEFTGTLNDRLLGFYRSRYEQDGKVRHMATTQFEASDARRAFPCVDNPEAKARFDISIITCGKNSAISNMPVLCKSKRGSKTTYKFMTTPPMPTYLVYLGVGEFEFLSGRSGDVAVRVVTTKGKSSKGRYALNLGKRLIKEYEEYFGIKYPLPKLDLIAIPDFAAGAMENWGAITFREAVLLYDARTSSTSTKQFIAEVISHELAHQWFGNLVTMKWWNDLWLNESFATFMATKFVDRFYPEWDLWDQFLGNEMSSAMDLDALGSSHPIDVKVRKPSEIREIFDAISYDKGGCILRMIEDHVTEPAFREGLKRYLEQHAYSNAEGSDLWDSIGKVSQIPLRKMVLSWIKQAGYPLLNVKREKTGLRLRQERFLLKEQQRPDSGRWIVPVTVAQGDLLDQTRDYKEGRTLLTRKTDTIESMIAKNEPPPNSIGDRVSPDVLNAGTAAKGNLLINYGRTGFYRVMYDQGALLDLKVAIERQSIPHVDRWAIQNDLYALCISGRRRLREYLDFVDAYADETNYLVSRDVAVNLYALYVATLDEPYADEIKAYAANHFGRIFNRLGWDAKQEKHTNALLRGFAISALGKLGDRRVTRGAQSRFDKLAGGRGGLKADLREPVYSIAAWTGDSQTHSILTSMYRKADSQEEKMRLLGSLYSFSDADLLRNSLDFALTPEVRSQNMQVPVLRTAFNPRGRRIVWPWLKENWNAIYSKVGGGNPIINRIVSCVSSVAERGMEKEIRAFFKENPAPGTERTLRQALEKAQIRHRFLARTRVEFGKTHSH